MKNEEICENLRFSSEEGEVGYRIVIPDQRFDGLVKRRKKWNGLQLYAAL